MKKILTMISLCLAVTTVYAQFTPVTIKQIQQVSNDSLKMADSLGIGANSRWTTQTSPYNGQKVQITALVVIPHHIITYTAHGKTLIVCDTGVTMNDPWSHIFVRYAGSETSFDANGYNSIQAGDIITMNGSISEFPTTSMNSFTQFAPDTNEAVNIISSGNSLSSAVLNQVSNINVGANPGGKVLTSGGEPFESQKVMFTNVTVVGNVNPGRGTWAFTDDAGNQFSIYDWSYHFTLDTTAIDRVGNPHDLDYKVPPLGTRIDTIQGFLGTSSGGEASRGYRICPIYPEDVKFGLVLPGITTHRRYPIIPTKDSDVVVQVKVFQQAFGGLGLASVKLVYKVNNGSWIENDMSAAQPSVDSLYSYTIPKQSAGSYVYYFIKATDDSGNYQILANSGSLTQFDSSRGVYFYKSFDRSIQPVLSIHDIQYTPFTNGRTPFLGAVDSIGGIITADTSSLRITPPTYGGTSAWYMQSTNEPWSGIYIGGPDSILTKLHLGDSVVVKGAITEFNEVTEIYPLTEARIVSTGNLIPDPVVLMTEDLGSGVSNGDPGAEPYEGMLVQFNDVVVSEINPTFVDTTEFEVTNSSKAILVRRDGRNTYSNIPFDTTFGYTILRTGNTIGSLRGIIYYANNRYKIVPRANDDFINVTSVHLVNNILPEAFALRQNFPNPFNPATTIRYAVAASGLVSLRVYNILGQEVATLVNTVQNVGEYSASFDASKLASGMYLYRLTAGNFTQTKKMLLLK